ncbi:MAG: type II secretion system minor pseudopilin GspK [Nitrospirae bacterium]|nr:type II secretion system minor pseudopilin GspK [Nitrospirota bacterium]
MKGRGQTEDKKIRRWEDGSALIITVLIVTILVALVVEFAYEVYIDTSSLSNWANAQKASLIAKSGQTLSAKYLEEASKNYNTENEVELPVERDFGPDTKLTIKIEDADAKININSILIENLKGETLHLTALQKLFESLNINPKLALAIADWIDTNSEPREGFSGSEDNAKNTYLSTLDELKLIKGIDKDVFKKISPYITVHEDRTRVNHFDTLININTAKLPVLMSLHKDMTEALAQRIIDYRETSPIETKGQLSNINGMKELVAVLYLPISFKSSNFRITARATVNEITRIIESDVDTSMRIQFWREE